MADKTTPIIAFEGIDGSGKSVQFKRLKGILEDNGYRVGVLDFPAYESFFGSEIGHMLSADQGVSAAEVDAKSMALWYAMDRRKAFDEFDLSAYDVVLLNRSTMANAAYQGTRVLELARKQGLSEDDARKALDVFVKWIFDLEFNVLKIPQPDLFFIFDISSETSRQNVAKKGHRDYVGDTADVYEKDLAFLEAVRRGYHACVDVFPGTALLKCSEEDGSMKPIETIGSRVILAIEALELLKGIKK